MNHNKKGKSQVTLLYFLLIFLKEILLEHFQSLFGKSNRDFFLENEGKLYYMKEDMEKSLFRELADWPLATSLRINLFTDNFSRPSCSRIKCLNSTCE